MVMRSLLTALLFTLGLHTAPVQAASFDCNRATTETEIAICDNPVLSMFNEDLSFIYSALLKIDGDGVVLTDQGKTDRLINDQREWLKSRDNAGTDFVDLLSKISSRIQFLSPYFNFQKCIS